MNLNDMLRVQHIDPQDVVVFRHRPPELEFLKVFPWLAAERSDLINAYQQTQSYVGVENALKRLVGRGFVASFFGHEPGRALFIALYSIDASRSLRPHEFAQVQAYQELRNYGRDIWFTNDVAQGGRPSVEWFDFTPIDFYGSWKGKLVVDWPPPERSWWRRAHKNDLPVRAILEESAFDAQMPEWQEVDFGWDELKIMPARWKQIMSLWRGIYYIFDVSDHKGYVGSAYGESNLIGRWTDYGATGHGGNILLRDRSPANFRFSILERVSPDMEASEVIRLETNWKQRLHTYHPYGLNAN